MSRIFISHSSDDDHAALALAMWLDRQGWPADTDTFLDIHADSGLAAGQRWLTALEQAATRCEAVVFLLSERWLASRWCVDEYHLAQKLNKKLFALLLHDVDLQRLPMGLTQEWQVVRLFGEPVERIVTRHPLTGEQRVSHFSVDGLKRLDSGLKKAGIGVDTFELQPDPRGPFGWRAPYRGLSALEADDAAVFFGRDADLVRGLDTLRGLATDRGPRMLVVLGASGAGKSSYLKAGLLPRLTRDDATWIPLPPIRAARNGAVDGKEGALQALQAVWMKFGRLVGLAELRPVLDAPDAFVDHLRSLREAARQRALLQDPALAPLPVLSLDQAEEFVSPDSGRDASRVLALARAGIQSGDLLVLATIRTESYAFLQNAVELDGIHQTTMSLGAVPSGEIATIIRAPAQVLRAKAGPSAPIFTPGVVAILQDEMRGESDALPLLAFALERLIREHIGSREIGEAALLKSGGIARVIEDAAEAALSSAGAPDGAARRELLRALFIPALAGIDRNTQLPERRVAARADWIGRPEEPLLEALLEQRLLVSKGSAGENTIEVAHEALLRRWPALAGLVEEEKQPLLVLERVRQAAADWSEASVERRSELLIHRGQQLLDAEALLTRQDFQKELDGRYRSYLAACRAFEDDEATRRRAEKQREERNRRQRRLLYGITAALIVLVAVAIVVYRSTEAARLASEAANSIELGARAEILADNNLSESVRALAVGIRSVGVALREGLTPSPQALRGLVEAYKASFRSFPLTDHARSVRPVDDRNPEYRRVSSSRTIDTAIESVAFGDGGSTIVAVSHTTITTWDRSNGRLLGERRLPDHQAVLALSADGSRVAVQDRIGPKFEQTDLFVLDRRSGAQQAVMRKYPGSIATAAFSRTGDRLLIAGTDRTVRLWQVNQNTTVPVGAHDGKIQCAGFDLDASFAVTCGADRLIVWDLRSTPARVARAFPWDATAAALQPGGGRVVAGNSEGVAQVWEVDTGKLVAAVEAHTGPISALTYASNAFAILSASDDATAKWFSYDLKTAITLEGHREGLTAADFEPEGATIVTASRDGTARVWIHAPDLSARTLVGHTDRVLGMAYSKDGQRLLSLSGDGTARVWDLKSGKATIVGDASQPIDGGSWASDFTRVVTIDSTGVAKLWDGRGLIGQLRGSRESVLQSAFFSDDARIVTGADDGRVRVWASDSGRLLRTLPSGEDPIRGLALSPGDRLLAAMTEGAVRRVHIWDLRTFELIKTVDSDADGIAFINNGDQLIERLSYKISVRDSRSFDTRRAIEIPTRMIVVALASPDAHTLFTSDFNRMRLLWSLDTGKIIASLNSGAALVNEGVFSADGSRLASLERLPSGNGNTVLHVWDVATGEALARFDGGGSYLEHAVFSPDGEWIVTGHLHGMLKFWPVGAIQLLRLACARLQYQPEFGSTPDVAGICSSLGPSNPTTMNAGASSVR